MKCVTRNEFLKYPKGTVYVDNDWRYDIKVKDSERFGARPLAIDVDYGEHCVEDDDFIADYYDEDLFFVYEESDVRKLKEFIDELCEGY